MKLYERLLFLPVLCLTVICIFLMIRNKRNYMTLEEEYDLLSKLNDKLKDSNQKLSDVIIKTANVNTYVSSKMDIKKTTISTTTTTAKPVFRQNKFPEMLKYSLYNPNFRFHTEWPPDVTVPPNNPKLADILNREITDNLTSWDRFNLQISKQYLYEENSELVDKLLHDMSTLKITSVEEIPRGMQFKLLVTFENGGKAVFKPKRLPRGVDMQSNLFYFTDYERHTSEIAAFHLDRILNFRKTPPVVGRKVNVTGELFRLADDDFLRTFFYSPDGNHCFHGSCPLYCDTHHGICGEPHMLEGSMAAWMVSSPYFLLLHSQEKSPWKRSYIENVRAQWEDDLYYCVNVVRETEPYIEGRRIYDATDLAIFDYLIGNMDRHSYEYHGIFGNTTGTLIHLDNGKGFGRPHYDDESILAPLDQCCSVRLSTFNIIYSFHVGPRPLSSLMRESLKKDPLSPILTEPHLEALDRRVDKILEAIRGCIKANLASAVFLDDIL